MARPKKGERTPGSGKPKGFKHPQTLEKEAIRAVVRAMVAEKVGPLTQAQITNALGIRHIFLRDEGGRFVQLTDPKQIETALNSGEEGRYYWTFTKDPSIQAYTDLMNRTIDKPQEPPLKVEVDATPLLEKLDAIKRRNRQKKG